MCTQVLFLHVWLTHLLRRTRQTLPPKVSGKQKVIKQNMGGHISTIILLIYLSIRLIRLKNTIAFSPKLPPPIFAQSNDDQAGKWACFTQWS